MKDQTINRTQSTKRETERMVQKRDDRLRTEKGGRFVRIISDESIIAAIKDGNQTTREIAEELNVHQNNIQLYIVEMYRRGLVDRRKIGATYVYSVIE